MKGIILAAGVASRLRPLTDNTPKCLLEVGGKPILQRTIDNLIENSIKDLIIVTGYLKEQIEEFVKKVYPSLNVKFLYNENFDSTNNIYSLWLAKESLKNEDFILLDSDIIFDGKIISLLIESGYSNCLALKTGTNLGNEEIKVKVRSDNSILEISKEVPPEEAAGESIGIEKFSKELGEKLFAHLDRMITKEGLSNVFYEAAFQRAINSGEKIFAVPVKDYFCVEIDFREDLREAEKFLTKDKFD